VTADRGPLRGSWPQLVGFHRYGDPNLGWLLHRDMPVGVTRTGRGRVGLLHYYRYHYRYDDLRLNGQPIAWQQHTATYEFPGDSVVASDGGASQPDRYLLSDVEVDDFVLEWTMTRLADMGGQDRAWVVFRVHPTSTAYRSSFALASYCPQVNQLTISAWKCAANERNSAVMGAALRPSRFTTAPLPSGNG